MKSFDGRVYGNIQNVRGTPDDRLSIRTEGLKKFYGNVVALDGVDLAVRRGEVFGFLGPNGAGKSTMIRILCGLLRPDAGTALVAGFDVRSDPTEVKRRVGYLAEEPYLYPKLTGREFLTFHADLHEVDRVEAADRIERLLKALGMSTRANRLIDGYSHGMRKRIGIAAAMLHDPSVLFLDEPTSGLDPGTAFRTKELMVGLAARGRTVFLTTHVLEIAQALCDRVGIIDGGHLVAVGTLDELRGRDADASLEDVFLRLTATESDEPMITGLTGS